MEEIKEYDAAAAKAAIKDKFAAQGDFLIFEDALLDEMLAKVMALDEEYIASIKEDDYYDDDAAAEYMVKGMKACFEDQQMYMMRFVDDYMEYNEAYLEEQGLIEWE